MKSAKVGPRNIQRRLRVWTRDLMADTQTAISRRRGSALVLVNLAYASPIDSRTGLLQGTRRGDRCYGLDGVVLDADTNAACKARLYDDGNMPYLPYKAVKALLLDQIGTPVGTARPCLECYSAPERSAWPWDRIAFCPRLERVVAGRSYTSW